MKNIVILIFVFLLGCTSSVSKDARLIELFRAHENAQIFNLIEKGQITLEYRTPKEGYSLLHLSVLYHNVSILELLIEQGSPLDTLSKEGDTPLLLAIERKEDDLVRILIEDQANPNISNSEGDTPLLLLVKQKKEVLVKSLIQGTDQRLNPSIKDKQGKKAIDYLEKGSSLYKMLKDYEKCWEKNCSFHNKKKLNKKSKR